MAVSDAVKQKVNDWVKTEHVFVASKDYCPYCNRTKQILKANNVTDAKVVELNKVDDGAEIQEYLYELTGQRTVPNIFINGEHIGGCSDLEQLDKSGALASKL